MRKPHGETRNVPAMLERQLGLDASRMLGALPRPRGMHFSGKPNMLNSALSFRGMAMALLAGMAVVGDVMTR